VPSAGDLDISYTLNGYAPQSVTVRSVQPKSTAFLPDSVSGAAPGLEPNPVFAMLSPTTPAKPAAAPKKKKRPAAAAAAPPADAAPTAQAPQQSLSPMSPPAGAFTPSR
jgi:hypothetical protein